MKNKKQKYLEEQLAEYEQETKMSKKERRTLRDWVASGHSVYESPGSRYHCDGGLPEQDFLDVYREDAEIDKILKGKTNREKAKWVQKHFGCNTQLREKNEATREQMKGHIRKLERELYYLWEYIGQEGLWSEAKTYVEDNADEPIPFEIV